MAQAQLGFHWGLQLWLGFFDCGLAALPGDPLGPGPERGRAASARPSTRRVCSLFGALHWADVFVALH